MTTDLDSAAVLARNAQTWLEERSIPITPDNFELAYAYAEGKPAELKPCFDALIAVGSKFDSSVLKTQHERFFPSATNDKSMAEFGEKISAELNSVSKLLAAMSQNHAAFGQTLSSASGALEGSRLAQDAIETLVKHVIDATRTLEMRTHGLELELQTSSREITELRERLYATQRDTLTDHLTGIANRRAFDAQLKESIERSVESLEPLSLVMFDIDHFKLFNDTWGHETGDHVLRFVAKCISDNSKPDHAPTRFGGEEFAVILRLTPLADAVNWADDIRTKVCSKKLIKRSTGGYLGVVAISAGVAQYKFNESADQFIRRADNCLYAAKHAGRNRVVSEGDTAISAAAETAAA